jgi:hypothetical protein
MRVSSPRVSAEFGLRRCAKFALLLLKLANSQSNHRDETAPCGAAQFRFPVGAVFCQEGTMKAYSQDLRERVLRAVDLGCPRAGSSIVATTQRRKSARSVNCQRIPLEKLANQNPARSLMSLSSGEPQARSARTVRWGCQKGHRRGFTCHQYRSQSRCESELPPSADKPFEGLAVQFCISSITPGCGPRRSYLTACCQI